MTDYLIRAISKEAGVRTLVCVTTQLVNDAGRRHGATPAVAEALGRALTGATLLGALLKVQQRVALKFEGTGSLQKLIVESDSYGRVRGYAVPSEGESNQAVEEDVVSLIGRAGLLTVVKDVRLPELVKSVVPLAVSDVAGDIAYYLNQSEQAPSLVELGAISGPDGAIETAGGILFQSLPPHEESRLSLFEERLQELPPVVDLLHSGKSPEEVLSLLFQDIPYLQLERRELSFSCNCSRERTRMALVSLGREELQALLEKEGEAVVDCQFCHEQYVFDREEVEEILAGIF